MATATSPLATRSPKLTLAIPASVVPKLPQQVPKNCRMVASGGETRPSFGQNRPSWATCWPMSANVGPNLPRVGHKRRVLENIGPTLRQSCPMLAKAGQKWHKWDQFWPQIRPTLVEVGQGAPTEIWPASVNVGRTSPKLGWVWPTLANIWPKSVTFRRIRA